MEDNGGAKVSLLHVVLAIEDLIEYKLLARGGDCTALLFTLSDKAIVFGLSLVLLSLSVIMSVRFHHCLLYGAHHLVIKHMIPVHMLVIHVYMLVIHSHQKMETILLFSHVLMHLIIPPHTDADDDYTATY